MLRQKETTCDSECGFSSCCYGLARIEMDERDGLADGTSAEQYFGGKSSEKSRGSMNENIQTYLLM